MGKSGISDFDKVNPPDPMDKATCLRIALAAAGVTLDDFASRLGVSDTMIYRVMKGTAVSARVSAAIDDFIREQLVRIAPEVRAAMEQKPSTALAA